MDFKKIISAAIVPTIILIVLGIINAAVNSLVLKYFPLLCFIPTILSLLIYIIDLLVLGWAGYSAAKKYQFDLVGSALVGLLAGLVSSVVSQIVLLILQLVIGTFNILSWVLVSAFFVVAAIVAGAVLGAIGGFLGQPKKK